MMLIGFWIGDSKLGDDEEPEKGDAQSDEGQRLNEEGEELAFHGLNRAESSAAHDSLFRMNRER